MLLSKKSKWLITWSITHLVNVDAGGFWGACCQSQDSKRESIKWKLAYPLWIVQASHCWTCYHQWVFLYSRIHFQIYIFDFWTLWGGGLKVLGIRLMNYDCSWFCVWFTGRPGIFNQKERAKWDAWKAVEGKKS